MLELIDFNIEPMGISRSHLVKGCLAGMRGDVVDLCRDPNWQLRPVYSCGRQIKHSTALGVI